MKSLFQENVPSIKAENITFSGLKSLTVTALGSKLFQWGDQHVGDCTMQFPQLKLRPEGWFTFSGNLSSSSSNDSWGILHIDLKQDTGLVLWSSGAFWSPTIGDWAPWIITSDYPAYLFDHIKLAQFFSHC